MATEVRQAQVAMTLRRPEEMTAASSTAAGHTLIHAAAASSAAARRGRVLSSTSATITIGPVKPSSRSSATGLSRSRMPSHHQAAG